MKYFINMYTYIAIDTLWPTKTCHSWEENANNNNNVTNDLTLVFLCISVFAYLAQMRSHAAYIGENVQQNKECASVSYENSSNIMVIFSNTFFYSLFISNFYYCASSPFSNEREEKVREWTRELMEIKTLLLPFFCFMSWKIWIALFDFAHKMNLLCTAHFIIASVPLV